MPAKTKRKKSRYLTDEIVGRILDLLVRGQSTRQIAATCGVSRHQVFRVIYYRGRPPDPKPRKKSVENRDVIVQARIAQTKRTWRDWDERLEVDSQPTADLSLDPQTIQAIREMEANGWRDSYGTFHEPKLATGRKLC